MNVNGSIKLETIANFWLGEVRPPLEEALALVPDDKLEWTPAPEMITLGNIFMHISEASDYWISTVIDNKESIDYTPCQCPSKEEIKRLLSLHWERLEAFFGRAPKILEKTYDRTLRGKQETLSGTWIMLHLLEHDIHHRSQINHYLRILGIKPPTI